jgi:hypothetical protein
LLLQGIKVALETLDLCRSQARSAKHSEEHTQKASCETKEIAKSSERYSGAVHGIREHAQITTVSHGRRTFLGILELLDSLVAFASLIHELLE